MNLPKQGTYERMVLDGLFTYHPRSSRSIKQIKEKLGANISTASLERVIESEQIDGRIINSRGGFALSSEARKAYYAEKSVMPTPSVRNVLTGPSLHPSRYLPTKGTRPDSDWSQFPSRQL